MVYKVIKWVAISSMFVLLVGSMALLVYSEREEQEAQRKIDTIRLNMEAQTLQLRKVEILFLVSCFESVERKAQCDSIFNQFGIVLPTNE